MRQTRCAPDAVVTKPQSRTRTVSGIRSTTLWVRKMPESLAVALHLEGEVDGIPPQVVGDVGLPDEPARHGARVQTRPQAEVGAVLAGEALQDALQLDREVDHPRALSTRGIVRPQLARYPARVVRTRSMP